MSQNDVWGFGWDGVASASMEGPGVGRFLFQLTDARMAFNKKGKPYVNAGCKVIKVLAGEPKDVGKSHWEYLSLEEERKPFTKHFFEMIGAGECLRQDRGPSDAIGCAFEADVVERNEYKNLRRIKAVDAAPGMTQNQTSKDSKDSQEDAGEGSKDSQDSQEEQELTPDDILAMAAGELKDLAEGFDVSLKGLRTLKQKKDHLIAELIGVPSSAPAADTGPRQAAVGAAR